MATALGLANRLNAQTYAEVRIREDLETYIRRLCGLFVFVKDSKIHLPHETAKEFLVQKQPGKASGGWKHCLNSIDSEATTAGICIAYLALKELEGVKVEVKEHKVKMFKSKSGIEAFLE